MCPLSQIRTLELANAGDRDAGSRTAAAAERERERLVSELAASSKQLDETTALLATARKVLLMRLEGRGGANALTLCPVASALRGGPAMLTPATSFHPPHRHVHARFLKRVADLI